MKESKSFEEQIIAILREAAAGEQTIGAVCRAHSIAGNTFWKFCDLSVNSANSENHPPPVKY